MTYVLAASNATTTAPAQQGFCRDRRADSFKGINSISDGADLGPSESRGPAFQERAPTPRRGPAFDLSIIVACQGAYGGSTRAARHCEEA